MLDLGCGTGNHAVALAELGFEVVGVDFAPGMLARASDKAAQHQVQVDLRQVDISKALPFDDSSFEAVLCSYVLQVVDDAVALLREVQRVLIPGGVVLVEVPVRRTANAEVVTNPGSRLFWAAKVVGSRLPGAVHAYDLERLRDELRRAGFSPTEDRSFARSRGVLARREAAEPLPAY